MLKIILKFFNQLQFKLHYVLFKISYTLTTLIILDLLSHKPGADPGFPVGGGANSQEHFGP